MRPINPRTQERRIFRQRIVARGGAMVEMLICMPLLLMLSFGAAEYGDYFFVKNAIVSAARDGARAAIPSAATQANVTTAVTNSLTADLADQHLHRHSGQRDHRDRERDLGHDWHLAAGFVDGRNQCEQAGDRFHRDDQGMT
jgi:hypothetical protein